MREFSNALLDLTDPSDSSYPGYLWEFPREDAAAAITDFVGETWSKPIVTKIRVQVGLDTNSGDGYERWVAIFGAGYDPLGDPNLAHNSSVAAGTRATATPSDDYDASADAGTAARAAPSSWSTSPPARCWACGASTTLPAKATPT